MPHTTFILCEKPKEWPQCMHHKLKQSNRVWWFSAPPPPPPLPAQSTCVSLHKSTKIWIRTSIPVIVEPCQKLRSIPVEVIHHPVSIRPHNVWLVFGDQLIKLWHCLGLSTEGRQKAVVNAGDVSLRKSSTSTEHAHSAWEGEEDVQIKQTTT